MRLAELNPRWVGNGGEGVFRKNEQTGELEPAPRREGVGVSLECPCRRPDCGNGRLYVPFLQPLDGGPALDVHGWQRTGETFETLTLQPSILRMAGCRWHGFITNGEVITC